MERLSALSSAPVAGPVPRFATSAWMLMLSLNGLATNEPSTPPSGLPCTDCLSSAWSTSNETVPHERNENEKRTSARRMVRCLLENATAVIIHPVRFGREADERARLDRLVLKVDAQPR